MKAMIRFLLILTILITGGCQVTENEADKKPKDMNSEELPDVRAFQDEFTRSFLQSIDETSPGYYPFISGTGAYKMDFPAQGIIGEKGYSIKESDYEQLAIGFGDGKTGIKSTIQIHYFAYKISGNDEHNMEGIALRAGRDLEFEKIKTADQTLFIAPVHYGDDIFAYAAYIQNNKHNGGLQLFYRSNCNAPEDECEQLKEKEMKKIYDWMLSVEFSQNLEKDG